MKPYKIYFGLSFYNTNEGLFCSECLDQGDYREFLLIKEEETTEEMVYRWKHNKPEDYPQEVFRVRYKDPSSLPRSEDPLQDPFSPLYVNRYDASLLEIDFNREWYLDYCHHYTYQGHHFYDFPMCEACCRSVVDTSLLTTEALALLQKCAKCHNPTEKYVSFIGYNHNFRKEDLVCESCYAGKPEWYKSNEQSDADYGFVSNYKFIYKETIESLKNRNTSEPLDKSIIWNIQRLLNMEDGLSEANRSVSRDEDFGLGNESLLFKTILAIAS